MNPAKPHMSCSLDEAVVFRRFGDARAESLDLTVGENLDGIRQPSG